MVDLSTTWLGLPLRSPFVIGASPLSDDVDGLRRLVEAGAGAVVLRSVFEEQLIVEQVAAHRFVDAHTDGHAEAGSFLPDSSVFSLGVDRALAHLERVRGAVDVPVLASLNGVSPGGWTDFATRFEAAGAHALELNLYDVATRLDESGDEVEARQLAVVRAVVSAVKIPVSVKISPFYASVPSFVHRLAQAGAKGVVVFNRFYQPDVDLEALAVDRHLVLSTSAELPLRLNALATLSRRVPLSLSITGGVHTPIDALKCIACGADTVQMVSALLERGPAHLATVVNGARAWLTERGYKDVGEARGILALHSVPNPHAWERANYARILDSWRRASE
jgi:dihydroorotate dehydrogenase (fumarate)